MDLNNNAQILILTIYYQLSIILKFAGTKQIFFPFISLTIVDKSRFNGFLNNNNFYYYYHLLTIRQFIVLTILSLYNMELTRVKRKRYLYRN